MHCANYRNKIDDELPRGCSQLSQSLEFSECCVGNDAAAHNMLRRISERPHFAFRSVTRCCTAV